MKFVAIDVETANANMASICSIGAAVYENGALTDEWYSLIDPKDYFDGMNVSIHGIDESHVLGAPTFKEAADQINRILADNIVVTHTHFDRVAMNQAQSLGDPAAALHVARFCACCPQNVGAVRKARIRFGERVQSHRLHI
jgi:DNA polymerase III epsilon subunit-like protein